MAGRKRRGSDSTGTTVENPKNRWTNEASILRPPSPTRDPDLWPCYMLKDATIFKKDGKTLANPLLAHLEGHMVVRGRLEIDDADEEVDQEILEHLINPRTRSAYIEITRAEQYSIGYGPLAALWVSGSRGGWFEILPSKQYEAMYGQVTEAITLYYSILDVYEKHNAMCNKKKKRNWPPVPTLDQVFLQYAVRVGNGIVRDEVEALCSKWAEFLIAHFPKENTLRWEETEFAQWLCAAHPHIQSKIEIIAKTLLHRPPLPQQPPPPAATQGSVSEPTQRSRSRSERASSRLRSSDLHVGPLNTRSRSPPSDKPKVKESPVPLPAVYQTLLSKPSPAQSGTTVKPPSRGTPGGTAVKMESSEAGSPAVELEDPVDRLLATLEEIIEDKDPHDFPPSKVHSAVYFKSRLKVYKGASEVLAYYGSQLLPRLPPVWHGTPFHRWLQHAITKPLTFEYVGEEEMYACTQRRLRTGPRAPRSYGNSPTLNQRLRTRMSQDFFSDEDIPPAQLPMGKRPPHARTSGLRPTTGSKKRLASEMYETEDGQRESKYARTRYDYSGGNDELDEASDEPDEDDDDPITENPNMPKEAVRLVVRAERIPTTTPSGPNGTWTCDQEGCNYVVRAAEEPAAQDLIQQHFKEHEEHAQRIELAMKESRGHMPISHLVEKIQRLGRVSLMKERGVLTQDVLLPPPVKRRLLI